MKYVFKKAVLSAAVLASLGAVTTANADVKDNPKFEILPIIVVWGGNGAGTGTQVGDFLIGTASVDLINSADVTPLITGTLDTFAPAGLAGITVDNVAADANSDGVLDMTALASSTVRQTGATALQSSFYVASNIPFKVNAVAAPVSGTDLSLINHAMNVDAGDATSAVDYGSSATANVTEPYAGTTLADISTSTDVLAVGKTATASGTIAEQSVRITNTYSVGGASSTGGLEIDPGSLEAEVTYVVSAI